MSVRSLSDNRREWVVTWETRSLKGLSSENDIEGYFIEKSMLISNIWLKIS